MPRITIDDLPPLESLTEEQAAEIFGAGPKFRPTFENLEGRELMATSLTASLSGGLLRVEGTNNVDQIRILQTGDQLSVGGITIQSGGSSLGSVKVASVNRIAIDALASSDQIFAGTTSQSITPTIEILQSAGTDSLFVGGSTQAITIDGNVFKSMEVGNSTFLLKSDGILSRWNANGTLAGQVASNVRNIAAATDGVFAHLNDGRIMKYPAAGSVSNSLTLLSPADSNCLATTMTADGSGRVYELNRLGQIYRFNSAGGWDQLYSQLAGVRKLVTLSDATILALTADGKAYSLATDGTSTSAYGGTQRIVDMIGTSSGVVTRFHLGGVYFSPDGKNLGGGGNTISAYSGSQMVVEMVAAGGGVLTRFDGGGVYFSPDGRNIGGGGSTVSAYAGAQRVVQMVSISNGGVVTRFDGGGVYFSPDGRNIGGGGATISAYAGSQRVVEMVVAGGGVVTRFDGGGVYFSPDGRNVGGGGSTVSAYAGAQRVVQMVSISNGGVVTRFDGGGVYFSPDGRNIGGGGATISAYAGSQRVVEMVVAGGGVVTRFDGGGVYFSPDGRNVGGGGSTVSAYAGAQRVVQMVSISNGGVVTRFDGGGVYFSPDGRNVGGGGSTVSAYGGTQRVVQMVSISNGGVVTRFDGGGVYFSPDGRNIGGGGATISAYAGSQRVVELVAAAGGVLTRFDGGGVYFSPDGRNIGGGGSTVSAYAGAQRVVQMVSISNGGVVTRFDGGGVYFSPDGRNIGGGGNTVGAYTGSQRVVELAVAGGGVLARFDGGGVYFSPDGRNLGGGGNTVNAYTGSDQLIQMVAANGGVLTRFGGAVYFSPDGRNLGGGGNSFSVYSGSQRILQIVSIADGGVITRFDGGGVYLSPDGRNLGGGGNTISAYAGSEQVVQICAYASGVVTLFNGGGLYLSPDGRNLGGGGSTTLLQSSVTAIAVDSLGRLYERDRAGQLNFLSSNGFQLLASNVADLEQASSGDFYVLQNGIISKYQYGTSMAISGTGFRDIAVDQFDQVFGVTEDNRLFRWPRDASGAATLVDRFVDSISIDSSGALKVNYNSVGQKWQSLGGATGDLGAAQDRTDTLSGGEEIHYFANGAIFWLKDGVTYAVTEEIYKEFQNEGGATGVSGIAGWIEGLGLPTGDAKSRFGPGTAIQYFEDGVIIQNWDSGICQLHTIRGEFYQHWTNLGGEQSALGMPLSSEKATGFGGRRVIDFENGVMVCGGGGPAAYLVRGESGVAAGALYLRMAGFSLTDSDGTYTTSQVCDTSIIAFSEYSRCESIDHRTGQSTFSEGRSAAGSVGPFGVSIGAQRGDDGTVSLQCQGSISFYGNGVQASAGINSNGEIQICGGMSFGVEFGKVGGDKVSGDVCVNYESPSVFMEKNFSPSESELQTQISGASGDGNADIESDSEFQPFSGAQPPQDEMSSDELAESMMWDSPSYPSQGLGDGENSGSGADDDGSEFDPDGEDVSADKPVEGPGGF